ARRRVADCRDDDVRFAVELDSPGDAATGKKLRAGRRRHAPDSARRITVMRRHLAPVTLSFALRKIIERQFARLDSAAQHQRPIAVIRHDVIAFDHRDAERSEPFMTHPGNVEMAFALAIQVLLAQIAVPALEQDRKETQFIFFAERGHCRKAKTVYRNAPTLNSPATRGKL